jgi:hypothetical protein
MSTFKKTFKFNLANQIFVLSCRKALFIFLNKDMATRFNELTVTVTTVFATI